MLATSPEIGSGIKFLLCCPEDGLFGDLHSSMASEVFVVQQLSAQQIQSHTQMQVSSDLTEQMQFLCM